MKSATTRQIPLIDLAEQHRQILPELKNAVAAVLESQRFVLGAVGRNLENEIAARLGTKHAIGLASGSDALYLSLVALGVGPGDHVVTTPFTFFATAGAVSRAGATPVFVDIDSATYNLNEERVESRITSKVKAIIPVHLFGLSCDMGPIMETAKKDGIAVVEDAAQSYGATYHGKKCGSLGDAACLSFYPTKNLGGAGDGGMVLTSSAHLADRVRLLRDHGSQVKYHHDIVGVNSRLDELQAAVLLVKMKRIDDWNARRRALAARYAKGLEGLPLRLPTAPEGSQHVYHLYTVACERRDELAKFLRERGIGTGVYYPLPLHLQPCYSDLGYRKGDFPESEKAATQVLSLPMFPELSDADADLVIEAVREFFRR